MLARRLGSIAPKIQLSRFLAPNNINQGREMSTVSSTPIADTIKQKIEEDLKPERLDIVNESHLHRHHAPMQGVTSKETHFKVTIVSERFDSMSRIQRHRHVYALLDKELKMEGGIHALGLITKTPAEDQKS